MVDEALSSGDEFEDTEWVAQTWEVHNQTMAGSSFRAMARRIPALVGEALRMAWQASRGDCVATVGLHLAAGALTGLGLLATTGVLRALIQEGPTPDRVRSALPALGLVVGATAARSALEIGAGWAQSRLTPLVNVIVERRLFWLTTRVELVAFDDPGFNDAMLRARDRGALAAPMVVNAAVDVITGAVGLAAAAGTLGILHPVLLPLLLLAALPRGWAAVRAARVEYLNMQANASIRRRKWLLSDLMAERQTAAEVRAYTSGAYLMERYGRIAARETASDLRVARSQSVARAVGGVLAGLATALVYLALGLLVVHGLVPLPVAGTAVLAIQAGQQALGRLIMSTNALYEHGLYFTDYVNFCAEAARRIPAGGPAALPGGFERITADAVTFTYPGQARPAVREVSLCIRRGEVIALVGENGSGKTTLARLLAGLYQPDAGEIRWDDVPLGTADRDGVWRHVALIAQDFVRWPLTAGENITIGRHERPDAATALPSAARASGADEVAAELPRGFRTLLDRAFKGGQELSGGQWQRVAVARGFYRDAALLICDEPTAALDARAEHAVYARLRELAAGRTVILITHRLASARQADRIYVLDRGRLIESGNHDQLLAADGLYADLFTLQASAYAATPD
jgi:ATP-binding cassette subfamily B protein/ATP-binding cassette subfamily C protein